MHSRAALHFLVDESLRIDSTLSPAVQTTLRLAVQSASHLAHCVEPIDHLSDSGKRDFSSKPHTEEETATSHYTFNPKISQECGFKLQSEKYVDLRKKHFL